MTYLKTYFLTIFFGGAIVYSFNWFVDPYNINDAVRIPGINAYKPDYDEHMMLAKAYEVRRIQPEILIFGTSRSGDGLYPGHPGFGLSEVPPYNLGLDGANILHIARYFQHSVHVAKVKKVVLGLDFFTFNVENNRKRADFNSAILEPDATVFSVVGEYIKSYFSLDSLLASIRTIASQKKALVAPLTNGMRGQIDYDRAFQHEGVHGSFRRVVKKFAENAYLPAPGYRFLFVDKNESSYDAFREILKEAAHEKIELHLIILPTHAWDLEAIRIHGLWDNFEDWKRQLVQIVEFHNKDLAGNERVELWDFSGYSTINIEPVPDAENKKAKMYWWLDAMHFTQHTGNIVLDQVLSSKNETNNPYRDFGLKLNNSVLEAHLAEIRSQGNGYRTNFSHDVAEIKSILTAPLSKVE